MKIIILGAGQVGSSLASNLVSEANDITVVDSDPKRLQELQDRFDLRTVVGHASHPDVLTNAGGEDADMIVEDLTNSDETNMVACRIAASSSSQEPDDMRELPAPAAAAARRPRGRRDCERAQETMTADRTASSPPEGPIPRGGDGRCRSGGGGLPPAPGFARHRPGHGAGWFQLRQSIYGPPARWLPGILALTKRSRSWSWWGLAQTRQFT